MNIGNDWWISQVAKYAKSNLIPIYVAGLSVLTRLHNAPPPFTEHIIMSDEQSCKHLLYNAEKYGVNVMTEPNYEGVVQCTLFGKNCFVTYQNYYNKSVIIQLEHIRADVRTGQVLEQDLDLADQIRDRIVPVNINQINEDPSYYWRILEVISYLPGYRLDQNMLNFDILCGNVSNSPLFRFPEEVLGSKIKLTYGDRIIRKSILNMLYNVNFPHDHIFTLLPFLLNVSMYPNFDKSELERPLILYQNMIINVQEIGEINRAPTILAMMAMPLYVYFRRIPEAVSKFMSSRKFSREYDDFNKLTCSRVMIDRCPLISWYFIGKMGFPSDLVFKASQICEAFFEINEDGTNEGVDEWVYVEAKEFWKEAISLEPQNECKMHFNEILKSGVLKILRERPINISNNELQKLFSVTGISRSIKELKSELYQFMKTHQYATIKDFRNSVRQKARVYFQQQRNMDDEIEKMKKENENEK